MSTPQQPHPQQPQQHRPVVPPPAVAAHYARLNRRRGRRLIKIVDPAEEKQFAKKFSFGMLFAGANGVSGDVGFISGLSQHGHTWTHLDVADAYRVVMEGVRSPDPRVRSQAEWTMWRVNHWMNALLVPARSRPRVPDQTPEHDWVLYSVAEYLATIDAPVR
jgi:hypothetical protein